MTAQIAKLESLLERVQARRRSAQVGDAQVSVDAYADMAPGVTPSAAPAFEDAEDSGERTALTPLDAALLKQSEEVSASASQLPISVAAQTASAGVSASSSPRAPERTQSAAAAPADAKLADNQPHVTTSPSPSAPTRVAPQETRVGGSVQASGTSEQFYSSRPPGRIKPAPLLDRGRAISSLPPAPKDMERTPLALDDALAALPSSTLLVQTGAVPGEPTFDDIIKATLALRLRR